jgi:ribosomal protein S18 acetylase RimI-like enzyme
LVFRDTLSDDDAAALTEMVRATGFFHGHEIAVARELMDERLAKGAASGYEFVIAARGGVLVGYCCFGEIPCTQGSYDLYWIVVHPQFQGQGLGKALLRETQTRVRGLGGRRIYIETSSRPQYEPTRQFYQRGGYRMVAELPDYYAPGDGKLIYERVP